MLVGLIPQAFSLLPIEFLAPYSAPSLLGLGTLSPCVLSLLLQNLASIKT